MPASHWFWRFMHDRDSAAWERRRDEPEHRALVERTPHELANVVTPPGPSADLCCGPGTYTTATTLGVATATNLTCGGLWVVVPGSTSTAANPQAS